MKGKTLVGVGSSMGSQQAGGALTPAEAAQQCENAAKQNGPTIIHILTVLKSRAYGTLGKIEPSPLTQLA